MTIETKVSRHAVQRIKERCGINKSSAERYVQMAYERGIRKECTKGSLRRWLDKKDTSGDRQIIAWGDKAFVFSQCNVLITVLQIPAELMMKKNRTFMQTAA